MNIGDSFNGVTILKIHNTGMVRKKWKYLIHRECCNSEMWIGHNRLLVIKKLDHDSVCRSCDEKSGVRTERRQNFLEQQEKVERIDVPGWGRTLGRMGMR